MAASTAVILLPLLFTVCTCTSQDNNALLLKVVGAIEKLVGFFKADYDNLNLDGVFGLKLLEGGHWQTFLFFVFYFGNSNAGEC